MENSSGTSGPLLRNILIALPLLVIGVSAFLMRWLQLHESLWLDELHTSWCVSGSWSDVAPRAAFGNQSPLYFYLLRGIVSVFGLNEYSLRFPSLIAGLGLVGVASLAAFRWTGSLVAGTLAACLVAIDRHCIFYSQEARPYAILQLIAWCHVLVVWELSQQQTNRRYRVLFVLGAVLQFYLHYTAILFLLAEFVFLLDVAIHRRSATAYRASQLAVDTGIAIIAALPAAGHLMEIHARRQQWELFVKQMPTFHDFWQMLRLDAYLLPSLILLALWYLLRFRSPEEPYAHTIQLRRSLWLLATLLFVPAVLAWLATRRQWAALFMPRYLVSSLVALPLAATILIRLLPSLRVIATGLTLAATLWSFGIWQQWQRDGRVLADRRQDWRGAVDFVNRGAAPDSVCYVRSGFVEADRLRFPHERLLEEYCLAPVNNIYKLQGKAIPIGFPRDFVQEADWLYADATVERWFMINSNSQTRQQFIDSMEQQARKHGMPTPFATLATFGDVLVCQLAHR